MQAGTAEATLGETQAGSAGMNTRASVELERAALPAAITARGDPRAGTQITPAGKIAIASAAWVAMDVIHTSTATAAREAAITA
jgi:hypothetical protein